MNDDYNFTSFNFLKKYNYVTTCSTAFKKLKKKLALYFLFYLNKKQKIQKHKRKKSLCMQI